MIPQLILLLAALAAVALAAIPGPANLAPYYTAYPQPISTIAYADGFFKCQGEFALCAYAECVPIPGSNPPVAECGCYAFNDVNMGTSTAILKARVKRRNLKTCSRNLSCLTTLANKSPFCKSMNAGTMYPGYDYVSTYNPNDWVAATGFSETTPKICFGGTVAICYTAACRKGPPSSPLLQNGWYNVQPNATCYCPYYTTAKQPITFATDALPCGPTDPKQVTATTIIGNGA